MGSTISGNLPSQTVQTPVQQPVQSPAAVPVPAQTTAPAATTAVANNAVTLAQLTDKLSETLKATGFKSEVDTSTPGQTVVRIVDNVTGKLVVQMPSANALSVAEALRKVTVQQNTVEAGTILDEAA